jgi:hypothetical protein
VVTVLVEVDMLRAVNMVVDSVVNVPIVNESEVAA